jgi:hypothetical protein
LKISGRKCSRRMSGFASIYVTCGWLILHWLCYGILARKLIVSERYKHFSLLRMMFYAGTGPCVSTALIFVAVLARGEIAVAATIVGVLVIIASCWVWAARFADPAFQGSGLPVTSFSLPSPSTSIALPILGPVFALLWVGVSFGLDELVGAGDTMQQRNRESSIAYIMAFLAAVLLIIYVVSVVLSQMFGISMYGYFFK